MYTIVPQLSKAAEMVVHRLVEHDEGESAVRLCLRKGCGLGLGPPADEVGRMPFERGRVCSLGGGVYAHGCSLNVRVSCDERMKEVKFFGRCLSGARATPRRHLHSNPDSDVLCKLGCQPIITATSTPLETLCVRLQS